MPWHDHGEEVPEEYMFEITTSDGKTTELKQVSDDEDYRVAHVLLWLYNHLVHLVPGKDIVAREELVFVAEKIVVKYEPEWCAQLTCFGVWEQEVLTFTFKLALKSK